MAQPRSSSGGTGPAWEPSAEQTAAGWRALASEPGTGVSILTVGGRIVYANDAVAQMMIGPEARGAGQMGRTLGELFPKEWTDERLVLLARVVTTRESVILRTLWRGAQVVSWLYPIHGPEPIGEEDGAREDTDEQVLVVSRRMGGEEDLQRAGVGGPEVFESRVLRLGELDALTPRELEVLALVGQGLSLQQIATVLSRSQKTISRHRESIGRKLELSDRVELAELAWRAGLTVRDAERKRV